MQRALNELAENVHKSKREMGLPIMMCIVLCKIINAGEKTTAVVLTPRAASHYDVN